MKAREQHNSACRRIGFFAALLLAALAPLPGRGASRAAQPTKLAIKSAALLSGHDPLTIHGDGREFVLVRPDFSTLKRSKDHPEAVVLHWPVTGTEGPMHGTTIVFLRLLKAKPSRTPKPNVDWDPTPVLSANMDGALDRGQIRISGFSLAAKNWASGKWPDYGMLVALNSLHRASASVTLAPVSGTSGPYFELRWPQVLPGQAVR